MWRAAVLGTVVIGATLMGAEIQASAEPPLHAEQVVPQAEVKVIHATHCDKKRVDPAIGEAPPAMGYECLTLLDKKMLPLIQGQPATLVLPNGRTFELVYNGKADSKHKVSAYISNPPDKGPGFSKLADISAEPNKAFNVGGFAHQGGVLLLTTKIVP